MPMTLRRRLARRYAAIVGVCSLLLAGLGYHEFVVEPHVRELLGQVKPSGSSWGEIAELVFHSLIPLVLVGGWWFIKRTLAPIDTLAEGIERIHAENLCQPLPKTGSGDEVDRLTESFNRASARLHQSFQQIRDFTLHASHELKTPLTVMRVQIESALRDSEPLTPTQREWMVSQLDEIQRLAKLIDSLTLLSKADAGMLKLDRHTIHLDRLVLELVEDALILAEADQLEVFLESCQPALIAGDRDRLRQLLLNLADNAVKYNRPGGFIRISLVTRDETAVFRISNSGLHIPEDLRSRVFQRFVRSPEVREKHVEGSGLGLAVCQWIASAHEGTIRLMDDAPNLTTFEVRLPLLPHPSPPPDSTRPA